MTRMRASMTGAVLLLAGALPALAAGTSIGRAGEGAARAAEDDGLGASARGGDGPHTVTWWCVDLNELWHVDVPVTVGAPFVTPPPDPPFPPCTATTFPIQVPAGSGWTGAGTSIWFTHTHYTSEMVAALEATGYPFASNSPMEDLFLKMTEVRYVVRRLPENVIVAEHTFDPRQTFRLVRWNHYNGARPLGTIEIPDLGINLSEEELGRLPTVHFPGIADGLPAGTYRVAVLWVFSAPHNDGLGMDPGNFRFEGANLVAQPMFVVVP